MDAKNAERPGVPAAPPECSRSTSSARRRTGHDRHRRHGLHRHAGPPVRQADPGRVLHRRGDGARHRGLQLPARPRHGHGPGAGLRDGELGGRLRRLRDRSRHVHAAACPLARPDGARALRRREPRRLAGRGLAAAGADRPVRAGRGDGLRALHGVELEFYLYKDSYAEAHDKDYRDLTPTIPYILDYHILATTMDEAYLGRSAAACTERDPDRVLEGRGLVRPARGEHARRRGHLGRPPIYKNGVKEIAFLHGISATFMAKPSEKDIGSSCHIHSSLVRDGQSASWTARRRPTSSATTWAACATTSASWRCSSRPRSTPTSAMPPRAGRRRRSRGVATTHLRVPHRRPRPVSPAECRIPGADVNPYLGYAALLAAGLDGIENEIDPARS